MLTGLFPMSLFTLALLAAPATAADHELSLELGGFGTMDERFDMFRQSPMVGTLGLRGAVALHDNVAIVLGVHHGAWGSSVEVDGEGSEYDDEDYYYYYSYEDEGDADFQAAYRGNQVLVGPKVDVRIVDAFRPYATVQAALFTGTVRLDDDPDHDDNENQLKATALQPGGVAALGFDLVPLRPRQPLRFGTHLELGYGLTAATGFQAKPPGGGEKVEIARFGFGGFYMRWGVGAYF